MAYLHHALCGAGKACPAGCGQRQDSAEQAALQTGQPAYRSLGLVQLEQDASGAFGMDEDHFFPI